MILYTSSDEYKLLLRSLSQCYSWWDWSQAKLDVQTHMARVVNRVQLFLFWVCTAIPEFAKPQYGCHHFQWLLRPWKPLLYTPSDTWHGTLDWLERYWKAHDGQGRVSDLQCLCPAGIAKEEGRLVTAQWVPQSVAQCCWVQDSRSPPLSRGLGLLRPQGRLILGLL